jgi:hypothetical protein
VLIELSPHVSEQDLQLTQLVLQFAATALQAAHKSNSASLRQIIIKDVLPRANQLGKSWCFHASQQPTFLGRLSYIIGESVLLYAHDHCHFSSLFLFHALCLFFYQC